MYLNYLEKNEKNAFLKIAHIIALSDGDFCENEKIVIGAYCNEMGINDIKLDVENELLDVLCNEFKNEQSKRIVILELMSIIHANGEFKESEKKIISQLTKVFSLNNQYLEDVELWSQSLIYIIEQGANLIQNTGQ